MAEEPLSEDEQLEVVCQLMDGEERGLVRLLEAYGPRVKWLLQEKLGDVLNEWDVASAINLAGVHALRAASSFDDASGTLGGWFYRIAFNAAIDMIRGQANEPKNPRSLEVEPKIDPREPACIADDEKDDPVIRDLVECVEELGPQQKTIAKADLLAGGEADAVMLATKLGIPRQHVYSYRSKSLQALLKRMSKRGHTAESIRRRR